LVLFDRRITIPTFEYFCDDCDVEFEELLLKKEEIQEYFDHHPCPNCKHRAERIKVSITNFNFAGGTDKGAGTGVHGNSGVHDLDYPKLDKAVGRSSEVKWGQYNKRKEGRDKVRRESGVSVVSQSGDTVVPASPETMAVREKALKLFDKAKKSE
jgi:DNA-directed RNA polymerase subunit RPC12/RpoP